MRIGVCCAMAGRLSANAAKSATGIRDIGRENPLGVSLIYETGYVSRIRQDSYGAESRSVRPEQAYFRTQTVFPGAHVELTSNIGTDKMAKLCQHQGGTMIGEDLWS
jgi:hypothetical protein